MINFKGLFYFKIFMYICGMLRYKKGDVVVCTTNKIYGVSLSEIPPFKEKIIIETEDMTYLEVGEQYQIDDCIEMYEKNLVSVSKVKTGEHVGIFDDKHFIPLDVWREFQLRKILE